MSERTRTDYFNLCGTTQSPSGLVCVDSQENRSSTTIQATNEKGDVVASEIVGETLNPSCSYLVKSKFSGGSFKLGAVISGTSGKKFTATQISINTSAGSQPTVEASGTEIPSDSIDHDCTITFPEFELKPCFHAQILFDAFALGGTGCYLTSANYTIGGDLVTATKDGVVIAYDVANAKIVAQCTVVSTSGTAPTITPGEGWIVTATPSKSEADGQNVSYTFTIECPLEHDEVEDDEDDAD